MTSLIRKFKDMARKNKLIAKINAIVKSRKVKSNYRKLFSYYNKKQCLRSVDDLILEKGFTADWAKSISVRRLRVFYVGTDEAQDKTGFLLELSKVADTKFFVQEDGAYGQYFFWRNGLSPSSLNTHSLASQLSLLRDNGWLPDILLAQAWGSSFEPQGFLKIKKEFGFKCINVGMDERLVYCEPAQLHSYGSGILSFARLSDLVLVTARECVDWYLKEGIPALYFPLASSPQCYFPLDENQAIDVGFIGSCYGFRAVLVDYLIKNGISVVAHGSGWSAGRIPFEQNNEFFGRCKIVLGVGTVGHCHDFYTMKLRDFDAPMSGACYITHDNPDLYNFFVPGKEIILCKEPRDFVNQIRYFIANEQERKKVGQAARARALRDHTYEKRLLEVFARIGIYHGR